MNTFTLLIFHLPVFILTYSIYLYIINSKKKEDHSFLVKIALNIAHYIVISILFLELFFWFILPAYNYVAL